MISSFRLSGTFKEGIRDGFVLKKLDDGERICFEKLQDDILKDFVPQYNGLRQDDDEKCRTMKM